MIRDFQEELWGAILSPKIEAKAISHVLDRTVGVLNEATTLNWTMCVSDDDGVFTFGAIRNDALEPFPGNLPWEKPVSADANTFLRINSWKGGAPLRVIAPYLDRTVKDQYELQDVILGYLRDYRVRTWLSDKLRPSLPSAPPTVAA